MPFISVILTALTDGLLVTGSKPLQFRFNVDVAEGSHERRRTLLR